MVVGLPMRLGLTCETTTALVLRHRTHRDAAVRKLNPSLIQSLIATSVTSEC
jgi:hypothetical protein